MSTSRTATEKTTVPTQVVSVASFERQGAVSVGDAVKNMAGLTLKDYGGVGGMKTVSIRGLGSQFSALTIDGVSVNDAQNGQIDLGRYSLGGVSYISLSQGQDENSLQPARSYASGSVINIVSRFPSFYGKRYNLKLKSEVGSFGFFAPTLCWEQKLGKHWALSVYGNYIKSDGDYPFTLFYGQSANDSSSNERRSNSQMHQGTFDANLMGNLGRGRSFTGKIHLIQGYHALPGPVTYYSSKGSEHSEEVLAFVQGRYKHIINEHWKYQIVGKYKYSEDIYEDTASHLTINRILHNEYLQQEGYLSGTMDYAPIRGTHFYLSNDIANNNLHSNLPHFNNVDQWSNYTVIGFVFRHAIIDHLEGHLLSSWIHDNANTQGLDEERMRTYRRISPYIGIQIRPQPQKQLRVRYFFKETYRAPSFSENYYFTLTRDLEPERATQHNLGIICPLGITNGNGNHDNLADITVDGYYNRVSNKIIAVPTQNMFLWSVMNLGRVDIIGCDIRMRKKFQLWTVEMIANLSYSHQYAVDKTDPLSKTYNNQIPYTPRHSGTFSLDAQTEWIDANLTATFVGKRYSMQENTIYCQLKPYTDINLSLSKEITFNTFNISITAHAMNLLNVQYEIVKNYPMMGRNYRIGLTIKL